MIYNPLDHNSELKYDFFQKQIQEQIDMLIEKG